MTDTNAGEDARSGFEFEEGEAQANPDHEIDLGTNVDHPAGEGEGGEEGAGEGEGTPEAENAPAPEQQPAQTPTS